MISAGKDEMACFVGFYNGFTVFIVAICRLFFQTNLLYYDELITIQLPFLTRCQSLTLRQMKARNHVNKMIRARKCR